MRRNLILLMVLGLSSLLQAMNYSGPVSWDPWFQKAEQHLNEFGFPIPDDLAIRDGVMVLTMDESISRAILPEPRDFSHVMPVFYTLVLDLLDPASLPLHRDATLATLLKGTSFEDRKSVV